VSPNAIDLFAAPFWLAVAAALLLVTPLARARDRQLAFCFVNLAFLAIIIKGRTLGVMGGVALAYALLRLSAPPRAGRIAFGALLAGCLGLFALYKTPALLPATGFPKLFMSMLAAIGFSYVFLRAIDVARAVHGGRHPAPSIVWLFNYLVPFHMLAAGPIQAYDDFVTHTQRVPSPLSARGALEGVERIVFGLFKKYVIAYAIERLFLTEFMADGWYFLLEVHLYALWFYIDFSAYSDIAAGLGKLMGIHTPENFNRPYLSRNMIDFWERWHITLGDWIRRNLYIVIQLELVRRSRARHQLLISLVSVALAFSLSGLWHGLTRPFFIWGLMHGVGVMVANLYRHILLRRLGKKGLRTYMQNPAIRVAATFVTLEWVAASLVVVGWHWGFRR
jgi:D-alanyl-lipoteichoic acid acyltransferase DltB (MBOAT superfamily)